MGVSNFWANEVTTSSITLAVAVTAESYTQQVQLAINGVGSSGIIAILNPGQSNSFITYRFTGLSSGTTYTARYDVYDGQGVPRNWSTMSVTTSSPQPPPPPPSPPAPTLNSPDAGATLNYAQANAFSWTASASYGGQNYAYLLYRKRGTSTWTSISISGSTQTYTVPANTFAPSTDYEWTVQTRCASYNTWSPNATVRTFITTGAVTPPLLLSPADGAAHLVTDPLTISWMFRDPTPGSLQTKADVSYRNVTDGGAWVDILSAVTTATSYTFAANTFTAGKQYQWRVRTYNSEGKDSPWSDAYNLYAPALPIAPIAPFTPADVSIQQTSTPSVSATRQALPVWQPARFEWQFATDAAFTQDVINYLQTAPERASAGTVIDKLPADKRLAQRDWYVRVRQVDKFGNYSPYSATYNHFTVSHLPSTNSFSPTATTYVQASTGNTFTWAFADTSETDFQTAFQIICERNDTGAQVFDTGKIVSAVSSYVRDLTTAPKDVPLRWKVKVWDTDGVAGNFSGYQLFLVGDKPPLVVTPGNDSIVNSGAPEISWDVTLSGARYQTSWSVTFMDRATSQTVHSASGTSASTRSYTPPYAVLVNGRDYSITVAVTDSSSLGNSVTVNLHTQFDSPEVVVYAVDSASIDDVGYVLVDWSQTIPDPDFVNWKVYRRRSALLAWELLTEIADVTIARYHDWAVESGSIYQYTVTQTVIRFGLVLESSLGYRAALLPTSRTNLSINPSVDIGIAGWNEYDGYGGTSAITRETDAPYLGQGYARITYTVPPDTTHFAGLSQDFDCTGARVITASAYVRQNQARMLHVGLFDGSTPVVDQMKADASLTDEWVRVSVSAIVPAGVTSLTFAVYSSVDVTAGYALDIDAVLIEATDTVEDYFDGYSSGAHWNGTVGLSTSTLDKFITTESTNHRVNISEYWILNYVDTSANLKIPNVTADPYTDEWEETTYTLIGRGRKKDYGTHLGRTSTLTAQVRGYDGVPKVFRAQMDYLKSLQVTYYLRTPFGDLIPVALGNISYTPLAGTGLAEMFEVSIPYEEVAPGITEDAGTTVKRPARMQVIDNGDGTLTLIPLADSDVESVGDIVEITF